MTVLPARTILVTGPPCSGKTTWVDEHRDEADLVLDFDTLARELGSPTPWLHPQPYRGQAELAMRARIQQLPGTGPGTAWVIRSAPAAKVRAIATRHLRAAACLVLNPGVTVCFERADNDERPAGTREQIARWYATYGPWSGDTMVTGTAPPRAAGGAVTSAALSFFDV